jgi:hypothetical protein
VDSIKISHCEIDSVHSGKDFNFPEKSVWLTTEHAYLFQFQQALGKPMQTALLRLDGSMSFHRRVQDRELIEMLDEGYCLSMHQPWASLLAAGIKL